MSQDWQEWFEGVWTHREERIYRERFDDLGKGIWTTPAEVFTVQFGKEQFHPGWLHHGVFACPPSERRGSWLYVTSGLSNPWNLQEPGRDPSGMSGVGFELLLELPAEAPWAVRFLQSLMAYQLLVAVGQYPGAAPFEYGNRVPLQASLRPEPASALTWLLVLQPERMPASFELPSGRVDLYQLVGITESEARYVSEHGNEALLRLLREKTAFPVVDPDRVEVV